MKESDDIIFLDTLRFIVIQEKKLEVFQTNLVGFSGQTMTTLARRQLLVIVKVETKLVNLLVINNPSS